jgi:polyhydroxybutyrate depolymerase
MGAEGDRDLKFFDAVLASLKKDYKVDAKRIYSTGHSNGGSFTYLLWETRAKEFAAFAPSAAVSRSLIPSMRGIKPVFGQPTKKNPSGAFPSPTTNETDEIKANAFVPKPVFHVAGENDPLVKFAWQKLMIDTLRKLNQCGEGKPWKNEKGCTIYESKVGAPVVAFIHPGTHKFPEEAPKLIVTFFKQHAKP